MATDTDRADELYTLMPFPLHETCVPDSSRGIRKVEGDGACDRAGERAGIPSPSLTYALELEGRSYSGDDGDKDAAGAVSVISVISVTPCGSHQTSKRSGSGIQVGVVGGVERSRANAQRLPTLPRHSASLRSGPASVDGSSASAPQLQQHGQHAQHAQHAQQRRGFRWSFVEREHDDRHVFSTHTREVPADETTEHRHGATSADTSHVSRSRFERRIARSHQNVEPHSMYVHVCECVCVCVRMLVLLATLKTWHACMS